MNGRPFDADDVAAYLARRASEAGMADDRSALAYGMGWAESMIAAIANGKQTPEQLREELKR